MKELQVPAHPIPSMQGAFAESMQDASENSTPSIPKKRLGTAAARRQLLIEQDISEETHAARWGTKPRQRHHQLWKLMAQISFGIYLLLNGMAKDENQVMAILQGHVDEVDEFLETTLDDFETTARSKNHVASWDSDIVEDKVAVSVRSIIVTVD